MKTNHLKYGFFMAILPLLFSACSSEAPESTTEAETTTEQTDLITVTNEQFKSSGYQLGNLTEREFETTVSANGSVDVPPKYQATVSAYFGGYVKQVDLLVGEKVQQGQVVLTIENPDFIEVQKQYLETKGELKYLKEDLARQGSLADANVSSQKKLTKAQSDFQMMNAKHAALKKKLEMMHVNVDGLTAENLRSSINVLAPISGYITEINASPGTFLSPSDVAMKIINTEHLHLELRVFEQDAPKVKEGQKIHFKVQNEKDFREATVHLVNRNLDMESRTVTAHGHIEAASTQGLIIGTYVESEIVIGSDTFMALPQSAVVQLEDESFVLKVVELLDESADFEKIKLNVGKQQNGMVPILDDIQVAENEQFLVKGAYDLIQE